MRRNTIIRRFVQSLAEAELIDNRSINIYGDRVRCENLVQWLKRFDDTRRSAIFIGEAPGRLGGAMTGIPFVSPSVITQAKNPWDEFNLDSGYKHALGVDPFQRERTATRFWKHVPSALSDLPRPLTWNIYPFWPFEITSDGIQRNRTPTETEIEFGSKWLSAMIEMNPHSQVVAVGIKARDALVSIGTKDAPTMPHPSRGRDSDLVASIAKLADQLRARTHDAHNMC